MGCHLNGKLVCLFKSQLAIAAFGFQSCESCESKEFADGRHEEAIDLQQSDDDQQQDKLKATKTNHWKERMIEMGRPERRDVL